MRLSTLGSCASLAITLLLLSGCGTDGATRPGEPATPSSSTQAIALERVYRGVQFYPACGNETLTLDGTHWYQLLPDEQKQVTTTKYVLDGPSGASGRGTPPALGAAGLGMPSAGRLTLPAVEVPGEGDDIGTVTVFADGMGHFVSDSGDLSTWLTQEERTYTWVC